MPASESAAGTASLVGHDLAALAFSPLMMDYIAATCAYRLDPRPILRLSGL